MRLPHGMSLTRSQIVLLATLLTVVSTSATSESSHRRVRTTSSENVNNDSSGADTSISGLHLNASRENQLRRLIRIRTPKVVISSNDEFEEGEGYVFGVEQEKASPRQMGGINIKDEARWLANKLRTLSNDEMGVTSMQGIYDSLPFTEVKPVFEDRLDQLTSTLETKLDGYLQFLKTNKVFVETLYSHFHLRHPITHQYDCCNVPKDHLRWNHHYDMNISVHTTCDLLPPSASPFAFNPGRNLTDVFQQHNHVMSSMKWQYFISKDGIYNEFPTYNYPMLPYADCKNAQNNNHRAVYVSSVLPERKNVLIMMDHGNSLSTTQLILAKKVAKYILNSLGENDRVGVLGLSDDVSYAKEGGCIKRVLAPLTYEAKLYYGAFIDKLDKVAVSTNHSLGFHKGFNMISNTLTAENHTLSTDNVLMIYISRGLLTSLTDARDVLQIIAKQNGQLRHQVVINTYVVIDEGKPLMYEKTFMHNVAVQNFSTYKVAPLTEAPIPVGKMVPVSSDRDFNNVIGDFYSTLNLTFSNKPRISLPIKDDIGKGVVLPISWPCYHENRFLGVMGVDIKLSDVVEGITYFNSDKNAYAFLIDNAGSTLMHPALSRPILTDIQPMHTSICHFEKYTGFTVILSKMIRQIEGEITIEVPREFDNTTFPHSLYTMIPKTVKVTYMWKHVLNNQLDETPFIVVIKKTDDGFKLKRLGSNIWPLEGNELVYHRLDLLPTDNTCMHLKQLATLDSSALFLTASSFEKPLDHLNDDEVKRTVQGYLVYLNDNTGLISNPGIRESVRNDVAAISKINSEWQTKVHNSRLNDFIVRRYIATPSGAMSVYPGTLLNKLYDPSKRDWYKRALESPGKVTLTAPYLDNGGAGYIVTISHTVYEGKHASLHGPFDRIVGVVGMDLTLKYFYKILVEQLPICEQETVRCFIMDDRGYLIAHKSLVAPNSLINNHNVEPNGQEAPEERHISHQEPLVANDILNHKGFVRKKLCNSFIDRTMQRYYHFNTSLDRIVTNLVHGEHCAKYQLTPVPGTNAFLGIVNQTCDMMTAFCPCSVVDRLCLNCHRMEQTECECPCECPLEINFCTGKLLQFENRFPSCPQFPELVPRAPLDDKVTSKLTQCFPINCASYKTKRSCVGVLDCEWCELNIDQTTLQQPFCSTQRVCFSGVVGAHTPYDDEVNYKAALIQDPLSFKSAPVGPVAGGIMGCFLLLALGVYCYRHHVHRHTHYISSLPEGQRNTRLDHEIEDQDPPDDMGNGHTNAMLASFENPASISPYRIEMYRRPAPESDLGYSTMTPPDSEQASTTCHEPLIIGRDRYRPPPTTTLMINPILPPPPTTGRRSSSPSHTQILPATSPFISSPLTSPTTPSEQTKLLTQQTVIPEVTPNQVIANVQVHMVDSH